MVTFCFYTYLIVEQQQIVHSLGHLWPQGKLENGNHAVRTMQPQAGNKMPEKHGPSINPGWRTLEDTLFYMRTHTFYHCDLGFYYIQPILTTTNTPTFGGHCKIFKALYYLSLFS